MTHSVHVRAPSRLHFGMFSFGHSNRAQYGGVGVMIEPPWVDVSISPADDFAVRGDHAERVEGFVRSVCETWNLERRPHCRITVTAPPDHVGLGVGTQLGLSIAAGLRKLLDLAPVSIDDLAQAVRRGRRSSVGTYGFQYGGLIVDAGHTRPANLGGLIAQVRLPEHWRFVLFRERAYTKGLSGSTEAQAFSRLPSVPPSLTDELSRIVDAALLPAIDRSDCDSFGDAVYRFGRLAGECFAAVQGGPFATPAIADLVATIRSLGVPGAGQSSWGPTVFAITPDDSAAHQLLQRMATFISLGNFDVTVARPNNTGAQLSTVS